MMHLVEITAVEHTQPRQSACKKRPLAVQLRKLHSWVPRASATRNSPHQRWSMISPKGARDKSPNGREPADNAENCYLPEFVGVARVAVKGGQR